MNPPRLAAWLVARLVDEPLRESLLGDLDERFLRDQPLGARAARRRYWRQAITGAWHLRSFPRANRSARFMNGQPMTNIVSDVRLATRTLWRAPLYSAIVIMTLALAIGANTLLFSMANPLVVRALPIKDPDSVGWIQTMNAPRGIERGQLSMADLVDLQQRASSFSSIAGYEMRSATLGGHEQDPERVVTLRGTANLTEVWGMAPATGRLFQPQDAEPGQALAAVLSHRFWKDRFAADPGVVGRQWLLDGRPIVVVGVMPASIELGNMALIDIWTPVPMDAAVSLDARTWRVLGRLAPGATIASADAEISGIAAGWATADPATHQDWQAHVKTMRAAITSSSTWVVLMLLTIVVGFVLLIACANLANLMMARLSARRVDLAVRQAMGASRWQLVRPLMVESLMLSLIGGGLGLALAYGGLRIMNAVAYESFFKTLGLDGNVLIFTLMLSALTPALFSVWPALAAGRTATAGTLRDARSSSSRGVKVRRNLLVVGQVALALSLLIMSTLAVRSMLYIQNIPLGVDLEHTAMFRFELPEDRYPDGAARARFADELARTLSSTGGVSAAAIVSHLPVFDGEVSRSITGLAKSLGDKDHPWAAWYSVTPQFFAAAGVPIEAGRAFTAADREGAEPVAIVNRTAALRYFDDPSRVIGTRINIADGSTAPRPVTIVGIAADTRAPIVVNTSPQIYVPLDQWPPREMTAIARADAPASRAVDMRAAMRALDRTVPITELRTLADKQRDEMSSNVILNGLFIAFAVLALLLAAGGLYGVISYSVGQRSREIGVRMALGAKPAGIRRMVLGDGLTLTAAGVAGGLVLGVAIARLAAPILEGVDATDPPTFVAGTVTVLLVAVLAILGPAIRAMRTDPAKTIRAD